MLDNGVAEIAMAKCYRLEATKADDLWDEFVQASPDGTLFSTSAYLSQTASRLGLYRCYNSQELRAVVALVESPDGTSAVADDLVIYGGICYGAATTGQNAAQRISERYEIGTFIASALANRYLNIEFSLAPSVVDIRPFLWYRYGEDSDRYRIDVRYTSYLDIGDFVAAGRAEDTRAYREASSARRQQIRYAKRNGIFTKEDVQAGLLIDFYRRTLERQEIEVPTALVSRMGALVDGLLAQGRARIFASFTRDGTAGSVAVFGLDSKRAYYLFGASDPSLRDSPTGTAVIWDALNALAHDGTTQVDLEGVNSPDRGWFKLSFGGDLNPYYRVTKPS